MHNRKLIESAQPLILLAGELADIDELSGDHAANDYVSSDMQEYYKDTIKLNHPSNRRRSDQENTK